MTKALRGGQKMVRHRYDCRPERTRVDTARMQARQGLDGVAPEEQAHHLIEAAHSDTRCFAEPYENNPEGVCAFISRRRPLEDERPHN